MSTTVTPADRLAIDELLARYNWAIDTDDAESFVATFADDGEFVTGHKVYKGHDDLRELMDYLHNKRTNAQRSLFHIVSNVVLEPQDDGTVRFVAQLIGPRIDDAAVHTLQLGWYDDRLVNTAGGWRFQRRHFQAWPDTAPKTSPVGAPRSDAS